MREQATPGSYLITAQLAAGRQGNVFLAQDRATGRIFALKQAGRGNDALAAELRHPNIVALHDADQDGVAMEYVDGPSLRAVLDAGLPPLQQALRWMGELLAALDYLHGRCLVHRDVKPANILLARDGSLKLADFGIAAAAGVAVQNNPASGTPHYMAPEQMRGRPPEARNDIYGAGVVLYEMLTGCRPYTGTAFEVMQQALQGRPPLPSAMRPALGRHYDALLQAALAPEPADRLASALEFRSKLQAAMAISERCPVP